MTSVGIAVTRPAVAEEASDPRAEYERQRRRCKEAVNRLHEAAARLGPILATDDGLAVEMIATMKVCIDEA